MRSGAQAHALDDTHGRSVRSLLLLLLLVLRLGATRPGYGSFHDPSHHVRSVTSVGVQRSKSGRMSRLGRMRVRQGVRGRAEASGCPTWWWTTGAACSRLWRRRSWEPSLAQLRRQCVTPVTHLNETCSASHILKTEGAVSLYRLLQNDRHHLARDTASTRHVGSAHATDGELWRLLASVNVPTGLGSKVAHGRHWRCRLALPT